MSQQTVETLLLTWGRHFRWGESLDEVMAYLRTSDGPKGSFVDRAKNYAAWLETQIAQAEEEGSNVH